MSSNIIAIGAQAEARRASRGNRKPSSYAEPMARSSPISGKKYSLAGGGGAVGGGTPEERYRLIDLAGVGGHTPVNGGHDTGASDMTSSSLLSPPYGTRRSGLGRTAEEAFLSSAGTGDKAVIDRLHSTSRVTIIVSGTRHELTWRALARLPFSRLGRLRDCVSHDDLASLCDVYNLYPTPGGLVPEFTFDRPSYPFNAILLYYQTGKLHYLDDMCVLAFGDELAYWGIDELLMEPCCLGPYQQRRDKINEDLRKDAEFLKPPEEHEDFGTGRFANYRKTLWDLFEKPHTSFGAKVLAIISVTFVLISTIALVLNSMEFIREVDVNQNTVTTELPERADVTASIIREGVGGTVPATCSCNSCTDNPAAAAPKVATHDNIILTYVDYVCIAWFTGEYIFRFWSSPDRCAFAKSPMNVIDVLAFMPFYVTLLLSAFDLNSDNFDGLRRVIQTFRVMRVLRVLKLARHSTGLQAFGYTMQQSYQELGMLSLFLAISILMFSSLEYFAEKDENPENYSSIPATFWWAAVSMTTVGYGDMYPKTVFGKIIAAMCCICGVIVIALPIPIIVNNFTDFYNEQIKREKALRRHAEMERSKHNKYHGEGGESGDAGGGTGNSGTAPTSADSQSMTLNMSPSPAVVSDNVTSSTTMTTAVTPFQTDSGSMTFNPHALLYDGAIANNSEKI